VLDNYVLRGDPEECAKKINSLRKDLEIHGLTFELANHQSVKQTFQKITTILKFL
jgi:uncharacterized protein (UPF0276 family)